MNDTDLDTLLSTPLPECDAGDFSVLLMERIAREQARPARIMAWIMIGALSVVIAAACVFGAYLSGQSEDPVTIPAMLICLTLLLSYAVTQSARA